MLKPACFQLYFIFITLSILETCMQSFNISNKGDYSNQCSMITIMFLSFRTDRSGLKVQTQIRLLLEGQSDQGLHCLQFPLHLLDALL